MLTFEHAQNDHPEFLKLTLWQLIVGFSITLITRQSFSGIYRRACCRGKPAFCEHNSRLRDSLGQTFFSTVVVVAHDIAKLVDAGMYASPNCLIVSIRRRQVSMSCI
jgi:hypothetical protein